MLGLISIKFILRYIQYNTFFLSILSDQSWVLLTLVSSPVTKQMQNFGPVRSTILRPFTKNRNH